MRQGYIYKLVLNRSLDSFNVGEVYIGKHNGAKDKYFGSGKIIKRLINKYGTDIFNRDILADYIEDNELLCLLEIYYIKFFKCNRSLHKTGLNLTNGGEGIIGFKHSEEFRKKLSESLKERYKAGIIAPRRQKLVHQYNIVTGEFIKSYINCVVAARELNCSPSSIAYAAKDKCSSCKGYVWSYEKMDRCIKKVGTGRDIYQYDLDNNYIKKYNSAYEACKINNFKSNAALCNCAKGKSKSSYGFIWKYEKE